MGIEMINDGMSVGPQQETPIEIKTLLSKLQVDYEQYVQKEVQEILNTPFARGPMGFREFLVGPSATLKREIPSWWALRELMVASGVEGPIPDAQHGWMNTNGKGVGNFPWIGNGQVVSDLVYRQEAIERSIKNRERIAALGKVAILQRDIGRQQLAANMPVTIDLNQPIVLWLRVAFCLRWNQLKSRVNAWFGKRYYRALRKLRLTKASVPTTAQEVWRECWAAGIDTTGIAKNGSITLALVDGVSPPTLPEVAWEQILAIKQSLQRK